MKTSKVSISLVLFLVFMFLAMPAFAQDLVPKGMQNLADQILAIFTSKFIQVIFGIFFCGAAVAYGFNKDNEKIKRNAIAIVIAAGILGSASFIIEKVMAASS